MLIEISDDLLMGPDPRGQSEFRDAMNNLLIAHRYGEHYVWADREVIDWLLQAGLSEPNCGLLYDLKKTVSTTAQIRDWVRERVQVVRKGVRVDWHHTTCLVPWNCFAVPRRTNPTRIIGENVEKDVLIYVKIAEAVANDRGLNVHFSKQGGGGDTTGTNLKTTAQEGYITIAVVDSDGKSDSSGDGLTARHAREAAKEVHAHYQDAIARLVILGVRELENLIPDKIWEAAIQEPGEQQRLKQLRYAGLMGDKWVDLKEGIRCKKTVGGSAEACYLRTRVTLRCANNTSCSSPEGFEECRVKIIEGIGHDPLQAVVVWLDPKPPKFPLSPEFLLDHLELSSHPELKRIAEVITAWGLAAKPTRY